LSQKTLQYTAKTGTLKMLEINIARNGKEMKHLHNCRSRKIKGMKNGSKEKTGKCKEMTIQIARK